MAFSWLGFLIRNFQTILFNYNFSLDFVTFILFYVILPFYYHFKILPPGIF